MTARPPSGQRPFCGREEQLEVLSSLWQEVRGGLSGPRTVVLLAEAGLGKTRLAQEFYARLVEAEQDVGGYWPPNLGLDGDNLLVNPAAAGCDLEAPLPFLWWGVRLADPHGHNQLTTGSLAAHVDDFLVPHLAAFHREQRRRQRLLQLAKVGGAVAADAVLDLVPFLGLLKKVGEVGMELKGIHDAWRHDRRTLDAATLLEERRDSLVDQLLADLDKLFTGPAGRRVPAVILVDDAQFSAWDPGVTAFLAALVPAMTTGRWPLLLVVTHWEREYRAAAADDAGASPVARIIDEHSRQELDAVRVLRLGPIEGLEPLVADRLKGLTGDQVGRLTARAGGNPQYLEEIVKLALDPRNRGSFDGRDTGNPLTAAGLETLLSKSVRLHDVVAERFASSPEPVQKAVALAGLQGSQFLLELVGAAAQSLDPRSSDAGAMTAALAAAEHGHGYVSTLGDDLAAFSQRIYQDVAAEFLPAFFDEDEALDALRGVVADIVTGQLELELEPRAVMALWRLVVALFEAADDVEQRRFAAHGLHMLSGSLQASGELQVAHAAALRQAALLETLPDGSLDGDLAWLRAVNDTLAAVGDLAAQRAVLSRLLRLTGETFDDDANAWSTSLYVQALLDVAELHELAGDEEARTGALATAVDVMASLGDEEATLDSLEAALRLHRVYGAWFAERGDVERAAATQRWAHGIATRLLDVDDGPRRRFDLAVAERQLGRTALLRHDLDEALGLLSQATENLRTLAAEHLSVTLEIQLAATLDDLADAFIQAGRLHEAEPLLLEGLTLMRRHLTLAPEASRSRSNLADSLERVAQVRRDLGDLDSAWETCREAIELRRAVADQLGSGPASSELGFSLAHAAGVAAMRSAFEEGDSPSREALGLLRAAHATTGTVRSAARLLYALKTALPFALARSGLAVARDLLHEADVVHGAFQAEAAAALAGLMSDIERLRALVLESDGDLLGATQARMRAAALVAAPAAGEGGHGVN